jgi:hypothetical protein
MPMGRIAMKAAMLAWAASAVLLPGCRGHGPEGSGVASSSPAPTPPSSAAPAPDPRKLVGRWLRSDSDYVIDVAGLGADGSVDARYFNPAPIHVSRSAWRSDGTHLGLLVELTDRNYPGSYYTVAYDPGSDALVGTYHQLAEGQTYEVAFSRLNAGGPGSAAKP